MGTPWPPRGPDDLDDDRRARMRREVLSRIEPRGPGLGDHAYAALTVLAAPAPFIVRAAVSAVLVVSLVASASVASADALPDEPLYGLKVAGERVRLQLARTPEDRAAVWLSMAEHRLAEAERLAVAGRESEAFVATSAYGTQLAEAAAELAAIERLEANGPSVVARLRDRLADQQVRAADIAERLRSGSAGARSAPAFDTVASAPPADASGTISELIAEHAASVTDQVAAVAEERARDAVAPEALTAATPPAEPEAPAPAPVQLPRERSPRAAAPPAAAPQAVGNVALPDPTATPASSGEAAREAAQEPGGGEARAEEREDREDREGEGRGPDDERAGKPASELREELAKVSRDFQRALEQIRKNLKEAHEAKRKAKERGQKTPSPAGQRSMRSDGDDRGRDGRDKDERPRGGRDGDDDRDDGDDDRDDREDD